MKRLTGLSTILILLITATALSAQDIILSPSGPIQNSAPDDIWPQTLSGNTYNEFWTYQFYLEGGIDLTMVFSVANFGSLKSPVSGIRLSVIGFEGRDVYQVMREYPIERLHLDRESWVMRLRPDRDIWFRGKLPENHVVNVQTSKDGVEYDLRLELSNIHHGYKRGDGRYRVDGSMIGLVTHIPYADVRGYVRINEVRKEVRGTAYMDHTFQDQITSRLLSEGYRYVYHGGEDDWDVGYFLVPEDRDDQSVFGYNLQFRNRQFSADFPNRLERIGRERVFGHDLPARVEIGFQNGEDRTFTRTKDLERFALLKELGGLARRLARGYLSGEVVEFRGEGNMRGNGITFPVHYNMFIVD
ncbi:MAG: hypothetical protein WD355_07205 [Balneolaceae bacterium]